MRAPQRRCFALASGGERHSSCRPLTRTRRRFAPVPKKLFDRNLSQQFEIAQHFAGAENHAGQGIIGN